MVERLILSYEAEEEIRSKEQIKKDFPGPKEVAEKFKFNFDESIDDEEDKIIDKIVYSYMYHLIGLPLSFLFLTYLVVNYDQYAVSEFIRIIIFISTAIISYLISFCILRFYWFLKSYTSKFK